MADVDDTQLKAEIDHIMERVGQIMEKVASLDLEEKEPSTQEGV